jgi:hypothetical protein
MTLPMKIDSGLTTEDISTTHCIFPVPNNPVTRAIDETTADAQKHVRNQPSNADVAASGPQVMKQSTTPKPTDANNSEAQPKIDRHVDGE